MNPTSQLGTRAHQRRLGSTPLRVSSLAIGGNVFGWTVGDEATVDILDRYVELGGTFIDTADSYAGGRSEILIGNWMRDRRNRADVVLATKIGKSADFPGLTPGALTAAIDASLTRLGTDYLDLLYLHIDDPDVPFEETLVALDEVVRAGKVRYLGASDHSGNRLIEARIIAAQLGLGPLVAVQSRYNLMHRAVFEGSMASVAASQGLAVMPRFALDGGFLTGRYRSRANLASVHGRFDSRVVDAQSHLNRRGLRVLAALDRVSAEHEVAPASIAIAWLLTKSNVVAPVASASSADQVEDLIAGTLVQLTRNQVAALDAATA
ncbi:aldo/keto reductase [Cryobacterium sp. BB736]|uniref:aldo/keto reductase n=1 Tax=Cryobacterium sp. BB736 TaxID=2746963 RepID=UPI0018739852|nr:aldo/keto reductase [Cryobacterium sp. BB736]